MSPTVPTAKQPQKQMPSAINLTPAEQHARIAEAAYFNAEHRGFNGGDPVSDWLAAEAEINSASKKH